MKSYIDWKDGQNELSFPFTFSEVKRILELTTKSPTPNKPNLHFIHYLTFMHDTTTCHFSLFTFAQSYYVIVPFLAFCSFFLFYGFADT